MFDLKNPQAKRKFKKLIKADGFNSKELEEHTT